MSFRVTCPRCGDDEKDYLIQGLYRCLGCHNVYHWPWQRGEREYWLEDALLWREGVLNAHEPQHTATEEG